MKKLISVTALIIFINATNQLDSLAQSSSQNNYSNNPVWIQMMEDPNVNFFEAVKAYNEYWNHREQPNEVEEETMTDKSKMKEYKREHKREGENKLLSEKEIKELQEKEKMIYDVKRFKNWMLTVKPFVQEDGRILSQAEIDAIWQKQQLEISNPNK